MQSTKKYNKYKRRANRRRQAAAARTKLTPIPEEPEPSRFDPSLVEEIALLMHTKGSTEDTLDVFLDALNNFLQPVPECFLQVDWSNAPEYSEEENLRLLPMAIELSVKEMDANNQQMNRN